MSEEPVASVPVWDGTGYVPGMEAAYAPDPAPPEGGEGEGEGEGTPRGIEAVEVDRARAD